MSYPSLLSRITNAACAIILVMAVLSLLVVVWNVLVCVLLRHWFRYLSPLNPLHCLLVAFTFLMVFIPLAHLTSYSEHREYAWAAVFTIPVALWVMRWETTSYIRGMAARIAYLHEYVRANGGNPDGESQHV